MRFFINGLGLTYVDTGGVTRMIGRGSILDTDTDAVPGNWTAPPDSTLLFPMDAAAQAALQASIDAFRAKIGPRPCPPGIGGLDPAVPIWAP